MNQLEAQIDHDEALRNRLRTLVRDHSQSEIARKTNRHRSDVSRYLNGRRVPADFCSALVEAFGVNPSWLLMGEGAPYLASASMSSGSDAKDLLELVNALNSVARMKLGALTGKDFEKTLYQLNEALKRRTDLLAELDDKLIPYFEQLLDEIHNAIQSYDLQKAEALMKAANQLSSICQRPHLMGRLEDLSGIVHSFVGSIDKSLAHSHRAFLHFLPEQDAPLVSDFINLVRRYTRLLTYYGRYKDAIRIFRSAFELAGDEDYNQEGRDLLDFHTGRALVHSGSLRDGLSKVLTSYYRLPELVRKREQGVMLEAQLYAGNLGVEEAHGIGDYAFGSKSTIMLTFAAWTRNPKHIRQVLSAIQSGEEGAETREGLIDWADAAAGALEGRAIPLAFLEDKVDPMPETTSIHNIPYFEQYVMTAYVAIHAGHLELAADLCERASTMIESFDHKRTPQVITLCSHWRNILDLVDRMDESSGYWIEKHEHAKKVLRSYYEQNYGFLRDVVEERL